MYLKVEANAFASPPVLFSLFAPDLAIYQASLMQRMVKKLSFSALISESHTENYDCVRFFCNFSLEMEQVSHLFSCCRKGRWFIWIGNLPKTLTRARLCVSGN